MKKFNYIFILFALFIFVSACTDDFEEINTSPNSATDAPLAALVVASQVSLMGVYESEDARLASMWTRQFTGNERQYGSYHTYGVTSEVFTFFNTYIGVIQPALDAQVKAEILGNEKTIGLVKVLRAMAYGYMTSVYGDIPLAEANSYPEIQNPQYESQANVYAQVQTLLDEAIVALGGEGGIAPTSDIFFGGDTDAWIEVAYSLKARYYLHTGDNAAAITAADNGVSSSAGDLLTVHGNAVSAAQNSWYDFLVIQRQGYLTAYDSYLADILDAASTSYRGDAKTDEGARFSSIFTGAATTYELNIVSFFGPTAPFPLVSFYETKLIKAEALMNQNATANQAAALTELNAVRTSLAADFGGTYDAYLLTDFAPAGIANAGGLSTGEALLAEIVEEKYVSLVGQVEVFNDMRRLDNPLGLTPTNGSRFPQRFLYPTDEVNSNENVPSPLPGLFDATPVNQ
jgi:hypothetical protein